MENVLLHFSARILLAIVVAFLSVLFVFPILTRFFYRRFNIKRVFNGKYKREKQLALAAMIALIIVFVLVSLFWHCWVYDDY